MYLPQSVTTSTELLEMVMVPTQIISPQSNKPVIGCIMDTVVGSANMTSSDRLLSEYEVIKIVSSLDNFDGNLPPPCKIVKETEHKPEQKFWNGRDIFSIIIPKLNYHKSNEVENVMIVEGILKSGVCDKSIIGTASGGLIHIITNDLGHGVTKDFLNDIQKITNSWLLKEGFSVGLGDTIPNKDIAKRIQEIINKAKGDVNNFISVTRSPKNYKNKLSTRDDFETTVNNLLNKARDETGGYASKSLDFTNSLNNMTESGSKGNKINISQIMAVVGQQSVTSGSKRGRIAFGFENRTLPHFEKYDDGPMSRGFVEQSYLRGLKPEEFFFHAMSGREGLKIDQNIYSS